MAEKIVWQFVKVDNSLEESREEIWQVVHENAVLSVRSFIERYFRHRTAQVADQEGINDVFRAGRVVYAPKAKSLGIVCRNGLAAGKHAPVFKVGFTNELPPDFTRRVGRGANACVNTVGHQVL